MSLPITAAQDVLREKFAKNRVTILVGETGSGKSTQVPKFIRSLDPEHERIAITQPRRVAAINLARRVADEMKVSVGKEVGYTVRFSNMSGASTGIKFLTDGMLLRELLVKPKLSQYTTIVLDEAHERTLLTDLLMGFLKALLRQRTDLRLVIMSATIDAERFSAFYDDAEVLYVQGRMYNVERFYLPAPVEDVVDAAVRTVVQIAMGEKTGDILVFLAGQEEIDKATDMLTEVAQSWPKEAPELAVLPLYAALPQNQQMAVFERPKGNRRKVVLATNIAETSLTIPGVRYVVDSGLHKVKVWWHDLGLDSLLVVPISQSSAAQRMGRAGREAPGKCYRLYTEQDYRNLKTQNEPEVLRCDVASPLLVLKCAGVDNVFKWDWFERPQKKAMVASLTQLYALGALDNAGAITPLGRKMALLPLAPHLAAVLLKAQAAGVEDAVLDIVSCLSIENLLMNPHPDKRDDVNEKRQPFVQASAGMGDLLVLRELLVFFRGLGSRDEKRDWCRDLYINFRAMSNVEDIKRQLQGYLKTKARADNDHRITAAEAEQVIKCFLAGFVCNTALMLPDRSYKTVVGSQTINIHPSSSMFGKRTEAIIYTEYIFTTKAYARMVSPIQLDWLQEIAPHFLNRREA
ncbi:P-loop containing nucleoside triphosphate hydrolase protein [Dipodascopsis tothii]|uniref:P-loop containing nucleoside triphosphate hydrolase protein n=1 Tax=Dipodascopsis tothii TaxID=44089 RepID=UPI0034CD5748